MEITEQEFNLFKNLYKYSKIAVNQIICMGDDSENNDDDYCQPCENREDLAKTLYEVEKILRKYE